MDSESLRTREFERILLIKLSAVGDVVHTIPVLNKLRRRYPGARIDWLIRPAIADLIRHHPGVTDVRLFAAKSSASWSGTRATLGTFGKLVRDLRTARYDLVIDMHGQVRTALCTLLTGAPVRIGFDRPRREIWGANGRQLPKEAFRHGWRGAREGSWIAYNHLIRIATLDLHAVDRYLLLGPMLGLDEGPADFSFPVPAPASAAVDRLLRQHGAAEDDHSLVVIAPGTIWETKHWKSERFAAVARHFLAKGCRVVLIGSAEDRPVCQQVTAGAPGTIDLCGQTSVSELAAIVARATVCITNNSGPMHLAVALDRPVVSIFGPTNSVWIGPYQRPDAVLKTDLPCAPCYFRKLRQCPNDHACMEAISTAAVIEWVEQALAGRANPRSTARPAQGCLDLQRAAPTQPIRDLREGATKQVQ